jgi:hypothetical protein
MIVKNRSVIAESPRNVSWQASDFTKACPLL